MGVPAVVGAGRADEGTDGNERGGEVEVEVDDPAVAVGAATQLAIAIHPTMRALDDPSFADLDRGGDAFAGDLAVQAQPVEQGAVMVES